MGIVNRGVKYKRVMIKGFQSRNEEALVLGVSGGQT
jgi:hypothetical protein